MLLENPSSRLALKQQLLLGNRSPRLEERSSAHVDQQQFKVGSRATRHETRAFPETAANTRSTSPAGAVTARPVAHPAAVSQRPIKHRLNQSSSLVSHRIDSIRHKYAPFHSNQAPTPAAPRRDGSWTRHQGPSATRHHAAIPTLLDSDDSAQIARPFAAPMDEPLSPFPGQSRIHSREGGPANKAALDMLHEPDRRTRGALLDSTGGSRTVDLGAAGAAVAEARTEARKKRFSPGDRLAYIAERVDFQAARQGTAYYALAVTGDTQQVVIHGGQFGSIPMLDVDSASNEAFRWRWEKTAEGGGFSMIDESIETLPLVGHSMVCYKGTRLFIYGGCGPQVSGLFSQVYAANLKNGTSTVLQTSSPQPPGRARHACVLWEHHMIVHGGHCHRSGSRLLGDMWALDLRDTNWERWGVDTVNRATSDKPGPGARFGHHLAVYQHWLFLAFGSDGMEGLTDIWAYHLRDKYWNLVLPRGKFPDKRVDCAASTFGNDRWLFHGGLDSASGTMLNSFYEFNFRTHEGRILRVELAVSPLKILPALMGHRMACMRAADGSTKLVIFGGINRQSTIVHVVYAMTDTGKSPGIFSDSVAMIERSSHTTETAPDTPLLAACNREPDAGVSSEQLDDVELRETQEENRKLKARVAELEGRLAMYPGLSDIAALAASTDDAIEHLVKLRDAWQTLFHHVLHIESSPSSP